MTDVVAFWTGGPLSHYEQLSLRSFARRGYPVNLFTYDHDLDAPSGVALQDAREVLRLGGLAEELIERRAFALLSDIIRYRLLASGPVGRTWVDTDVVLLSDRLPEGPYLFARESTTLVNGAVLRLPSGSPLLSDLLTAVDGLHADAAVAAPWGTFGPKLLTRLVLERGLEEHAHPSATLYPIHHRQTWRLFDPNSSGWCARATEGSVALHLWNEIVHRAGLRGARPPEGSYLAELLERNGIDVSAPPVSRRAVRRWAVRIDAEQRTPLDRARRRIRKRVRRSIRRSRAALRPLRRAFTM